MGPPDDYEVEYNNRARVPEHPDLIAGWARDAGAWRARQAPRLLRYGPGSRHVIDFFPGRDDGPIVVFIHGGYWQALDNSFFSHLAGGLNAHGIGGANVTLLLRAPQTKLASLPKDHRNFKLIIYQSQPQ